MPSASPNPFWRPKTRWPSYTAIINMLLESGYSFPGPLSDEELQKHFRAFDKYPFVIMPNTGSEWIDHNAAESKVYIDRDLIPRDDVFLLMDYVTRCVGLRAFVGSNYGQP